MSQNPFSTSSFSTTIAELLWPTRCVVCDKPGELLCSECRAHLHWIEQRSACPECGTPHGWLCCTNCGAEKIHSQRFRNTLGISSKQNQAQVRWEPRTTICALEYQGAGSRLAKILKDAHELRLASIIAAILATSLDEASAWCAYDRQPRFDLANLDAICFVPATAQAYVRRGFDHMELIAQALSLLIGLPIADVLVRTSAHDQRNLERMQRKENLYGSIEVIGDVVGSNLLLIDDVITTGSTIRESARMLISQGASPPTAAALARVW